MGILGAEWRGNPGELRLRHLGPESPEQLAVKGHNGGPPETHRGYHSFAVELALNRRFEPPPLPRRNARPKLAPVVAYPVEAYFDGLRRSEPGEMKPVLSSVRSGRLHGDRLNPVSPETSKGSRGLAAFPLPPAGSASAFVGCRREGHDIAFSRIAR